MTTALFHSVDYHLPEEVLDNAGLENRFPDFPAQKILAKTGIERRHLAGPRTCASDLALAAAERLFQPEGIDRLSVDALIFCTQTPDYWLPATACLLQDRLGLTTGVAAFDFNLGCSGYVYGLGLAKGLIETHQAKRVLLLTGDTYSKLLAEDDRGVRALFGDAASATLIDAMEGNEPAIGPFAYGTDGRGAAHLQVAVGGFRNPVAGGLPRLTMNGPEVFNFTLDVVPSMVRTLLERSGLRIDDIDLFVFHQANAYMLQHLQRKLSIPDERFSLRVSHCGNTVSSSIPIALREEQREGRLQPGMRLMLVGFGVGLSWGATLLKWTGQG